MSFFARVQQIVVAKLEGAIESAGRSSSLGLMREAMNEVERAVELHEREIRTARGVQRDNQTRVRRLREELKSLEENARFALSKDRPDLARAALKQQINVEGRIKCVGQASADAAQIEMRAESRLTAAKERWQAMRAEFEALRRARASAAEDLVAGTNDSVTEERLHGAEKAFARAAEVAGEAVGGRVDPVQAAGVDEIEALKVEAEIAARLEVMQVNAAAKKPAGPVKRASRKR